MGIFTDNRTAFRLCSEEESDLIVPSAHVGCGLYIISRHFYNKGSLCQELCVLYIIPRHLHTSFSHTQFINVWWWRHQLVIARLVLLQSLRLLLDQLSMLVKFVLVLLRKGNTQLTGSLRHCREMLRKGTNITKGTATLGKYLPKKSNISLPQPDHKILLRIKKQNRFCQNKFSMYPHKIIISK